MIQTMKRSLALLIALMMCLSLVPTLLVGVSADEFSYVYDGKYIYNWGTNYQNMPRASVMSWMLFYIIFIISALNFKLRRKWVDE